MDPVSIYIHIPFCVHRCAYCDFNTYAGMEKWIPEYIDALCKEIVYAGEAAPYPIKVHTIFFGGGTPSHIPAQYIRKILSTIKSQFEVDPNAEITLEANPGTITENLLGELAEAGINRLSIGMQSAIPDELILLTRNHSPEDVKNTIFIARKSGFQNINLDLIFGIPGQSLNKWKQSLDFAMTLEPEHLSLYSLTVEEGTPLFKWVKNKKVSMPSDDETADLYEFSMDYLSDAGFLQYEISNWAKENKTGEWLICRHNLQYWKYLPYLGFGAGAHGFFGETRTANVLEIPQYIEKIHHPSSCPFPVSPANEQAITLHIQEQMKEYMMVGLRLTHEGINVNEFYTRFGSSILKIFGKEIDFLLSRGLLEWINDGNNLRLTRLGKLLGNQVFIHFV